MTNESALDRLFRRLTFVPELMREPGIRTQATNDADTKLFNEAMSEYRKLFHDNFVMRSALVNIKANGSKLDYDSSECATDALELCRQAQS